MSLITPVIISAEFITKGVILLIDVDTDVGVVTITGVRELLLIIEELISLFIDGREEINDFGRSIFC